jgi:hypothetical protein
MGRRQRTARSRCLRRSGAPPHRFAPLPLNRAARSLSPSPARRYPATMPHSVAAMRKPGRQRPRTGAPRSTPRRPAHGSRQRSDASPPPANAGDAASPRRSGRPSADRWTLVPLVRSCTQRHTQPTSAEGVVHRALTLSPSVEILQVGGIGAIVLVRAAFSRTVSAFVGYALVDLVGIERVQRGLRWDTVMPLSEELWAKPRTREDDEPTLDALPPEVSDET